MKRRSLLQRLAGTAAAAMCPVSLAAASATTTATAAPSYDAAWNALFSHPVGRMFYKRLVSDGPRGVVMEIASVAMAQERFGEKVESMQADPSFLGWLLPAWAGDACHLLSFKRPEPSGLVRARHLPTYGE